MTKAQKATIYWGLKSTQASNDIELLKEEDFRFASEVYFYEEETNDKALQCLSHIGYLNERSTEEKVLAFQKDYLPFFRKLAETATERVDCLYELGSKWPDSATRNAIFYVNKNGIETIDGQLLLTDEDTETDENESDYECEYDENDDVA